MSQVLIAYRDSGCRYRKRNLKYLTDYWQSHDWEVIVGTGPLEGPFSLSAARNEAVKASTDDVLVMMDADVVIPIHLVTGAIDVATETGGLVFPFSVVRFLHRNVTHRVIRNEISPFVLNHRRVAREYDFTFPWGGAYVIRRDSWEQVGGMDERFKGYGAEDVIFKEQCDDLFGESRYIDGMAYHLWHPSVRVVNPENDRMLTEYRESK